jgi:hypothetical protein
MSFVSLDIKNVHFLLDPKNSEVKSAYIDCLSMLHDVLIGFTSDPEYPIFEYFNQKIEFATITSFLSKHPFPPYAVDVGINITRNAEIAFDLRKKAMSPSSTTSSAIIRWDIDNYVDKLLIQYRNLR